MKSSTDAARSWMSATLVVVVLIGAASGTARAANLVTVLSGLSNPVFVTHAGDGSNRLFIVEQIGRIRVLPPGGSEASVFLDISSQVFAGGERGLLGLAFHPRYGTNGRFFVYYTRAGDGALTIAEFHVSADATRADTAERVLLTIPHPTFGNHNGGMLAFGPDGYLYIGTGDGGSANDPGNNAQDPERLLGKILRVDVGVSAPSDGQPYAIPPDNPLVARPGRDEIYALGLRNPWRFSFDRITGQQWVGDVGQGLREEVDTPIAKGANYGWRVFEGSVCTNNDPSLCNPNAYFFPAFEYAHTGGRCSITGGYVYRGTLATFPSGTYIFGDYCTGEILQWDGAAQRLLFDTDMRISSFGEDEQGELYVVDITGSVSRIAPDQQTGTGSCEYTVTPERARFGATGGRARIHVSTPDGCAWTAIADAPWISIDGKSRRGSGSVTYRTARLLGRPGTRTATIFVAGEPIIVTQTR